MELNSRQLVALGAPAMVVYLTWSAVSGASAAAPAAPPVTSVSTAAMAKRPVIAKLERDVFTRSGAFADGTAATAPGEEGGSGGVHLTGTVVTGRWRMAIIDGTRVFEGQTFRGLVVKTIARDKVTLADAEGQTTELTLEIAQPPALPASARGGPGAAAAAATSTGSAGSTSASTAPEHAADGSPSSAAAVRKPATTTAARSTNSGTASASSRRGADTPKEPTR